MAHLTPDQFTILKEAKRIRPSGLELGTECPLSQGILLSVHGYGSITKDRPQMFTINDRGEEALRFQEFDYD